MQLFHHRVNVNRKKLHLITEDKVKLTIDLMMKNNPKLDLLSNMKDFLSFNNLQMVTRKKIGQIKLPPLMYEANHTYQDSKMSFNNHY